MDAVASHRTLAWVRGLRAAVLGAFLQIEVEEWMEATAVRRLCPGAVAEMAGNGRGNSATPMAISVAAGVARERDRDARGKRVVRGVAVWPSRAVRVG